jgi:thioredoxin 1
LLEDIGILDLDEDNFDETIRNGGGTILVDFWASWCGPCKQLAPRLEQLATELKGRARVAKVNVETEGNLANRYNVRSVPTLMLFRDGRVVDQMVGAAPTDQIRHLIDKHLTPA